VTLRAYSVRKLISVADDRLLVRNADLRPQPRSRLLPEPRLDLRRVAPWRGSVRSRPSPARRTRKDHLMIPACWPRVPLATPGLLGLATPSEAECASLKARWP